MALTFYRVLQLQHLSYIRVGSIIMGDVGISLHKRPGKAYLELLVAAYNNFEKIFVVNKFRGFPKFAKNAKIELLEN